MSLLFFHTELAFIGIGIPISPTDGQVQEGAGLQVTKVFTHRLERRNHSSRFSASNNHFFAPEHPSRSKCHWQPGSLCLRAGAAECLSGTCDLGFGVVLVALRLGMIAGNSLSPRYTRHTHLKPLTKKTRSLLPFSDHSLHSALPLKQSRDP